MKKFFTFLVIFLLVPMVRAYAAGNAEVALSDTCVGHSTKYTVSFFIETDINIGDNISLEFDENIPIFRNNGEASEITVNDVKLKESPKFLGNIIDITSPVSVRKRSKLTIVIPQGILQNPDTPGYFTLSVSVNGKTYASDYYHITNKSTVKNVLLKSTEDGIEIEFETGFRGMLKGYITKTVHMGSMAFSKAVPQDFIFLRFSHVLSEMVPSISKSNITINGKNPPINPDVKLHFKGTNREEKGISVCVPENINANRDVKIFIKGILMPEKESGEIYVKVWTSKEFTPVISNKIHFFGKYFLETHCTVSPKSPHKNGFYNTSPVVRLEVVKGIGITETETYYGFDGKNFVLYSSPVKISDGKKVLFYYTVGYSGNRKFVEGVHKISFKVDTVPPEIEIHSPLSVKSPFYELKITFNEENFDYAVVTVYGIDFTITDKNADIPIYLFDKDTQFSVKAFDKAGNESEKNGQIVLDKEGG